MFAGGYSHNLCVRAKRKNNNIQLAGVSGGNKKNEFRVGVCVDLREPSSGDSRGVLHLISKGQVTSHHCTFPYNADEGFVPAIHFSHKMDKVIFEVPHRLSDQEVLSLPSAVVD